MFMTSDMVLDKSLECPDSPLAQHTHALESVFCGKAVVLSSGDKCG